MADIRARCRPGALAKQMERIGAFPLTALVAPIGYGKSTAIQMALADRPSVTIQCQADAPLSAQLRAVIDASAEEDLWDLLSQLPAGTVLVFEDYQHCAGQAEADGLLSDLLIALQGRCPVVLLSRRDVGLTRDTELLLHGMLYRIEAEDFLFQPEELRDWFRDCGFPLAADEVAQLYALTEGWPAMCYLALLQYSRTGSLQELDATPLMATVYDQLPETCRKLLWYLSAAQEFTEEDAITLWGSRDGVALVHQLRDEGAPLTQRGAEWHLHPALAAYVQKQVEALNETNRASIARRLGRWYQNQGAFEQAAAAFEEAGDWDQLLTLLEEDAGGSMSVSFAEQTTRILLRCPREFLNRHPLAQFYYARQVATLGRPELLQRWRPQDAGQAALVDLQAAYPEIEQMVRFCRAAREHKLPSTAKEPFTLGRLSLLGTYHRTGQAETSLKYLEEYLNLYVPLSGGHGAGALEAARAEHAYLRGALSDAQINAHSAQLIARENRQGSVQMAALFLLARCAFAQGDWPQTQRCLTQLRERAGTNRMLRQTADLAEAWFHALLGRPAQCAPWIQEGTGLELMPPARPDDYVVAGLVLLQQQEWPRVIASCQRWLTLMDPWRSDLPSLYLQLYLAAAYTRLDHPQQAQEALTAALALAQDNQWLLPFAELSAHLWPWRAQLPEAWAEACQAYQKSLDTMQLQPRVRLQELSQRENQVAQLMCDGASNQQIARQLGISINTVKTTIRHIHSKLNTDSRQALRQKLHPSP